MSAVLRLTTVGEIVAYMARVGLVAEAHEGCSHGCTVRVVGELAVIEARRRTPGAALVAALVLYEAVRAGEAVALAVRS